MWFKTFTSTVTHNALRLNGISERGKPPSEEASMKRLVQNAVALSAMSAVSACSWVDSTGRTHNAAPDIQFDAAVAIIDARSSLRIPVNDDTGVDAIFTLETEHSDPIASCSQWLPAEQFAPSLEQACVDANNCDMRFDADPESPNTYQLTAPAVRQPVAMSYQITAEDHDGEMDHHRFDLCINPVDDAPITQIDAYSVQYQKSLNITGASFDNRCQIIEGQGVLYNDQDDFDYSTGDIPHCLTAAIAESPSAHQGRFHLDGDGGFTYISDGTLGPGTVDSFSYTAFDGNTASGLTQVSIRITGENATPQENSVTEFTTPFETTLKLTPGQVATDPEGFELSFIGVGGAQHGDAALNNGELHYSPNPNFSGEDHFEATVSDPAGGTAQIAIQVLTRPTNQHPQLSDFRDLAFDATLEASTIELTVSDPETESQALELSVSSSAPSVVSAVLLAQPNAAGRSSFSLQPLQNGESTIRVSVVDRPVNDQPANSVTRTFTVRVSGLRDPEDNQSPRAVNDRIRIASTANESFNVAENDTDADNDTLSYRLLDAGQLGSAVQLSVEGILTVDAPLRFNRSVYWVRYQVDDGFGGIDNAWVRIIVDSIFDD